MYYIMYNIQCTVYIAHWSMNSVQCTLYIIYGVLCTLLLCTMYNVQCTYNNIRINVIIFSTQHVHCVIYAVHCTLYMANCTVYII